MLKRWHFSNFKSFQTLPPLDFAQINVLAGANSSGKSSIIQTMLLLKQTLQYGSENRSITLNGPLLRLGGFDDVRNFDAFDDDLKIGFDFEFDEDEMQNASRPFWVRTLFRRAAWETSASPSALSLSLSYGEKKAANAEANETSGARSLSPNLNEVNLTLSRFFSEKNLTQEYFVKLSRRITQLSDEDDAIGVQLKYNAMLDQESEQVIFKDKPRASLQGGDVSYFLPRWIAVRFDSAAQTVRKFVDDLCNPSISLLSGSKLADKPASETVVKIVNDWLRAKAAESFLPADATVTEVEVHRFILPYLRRSARFGDLLGTSPLDTERANKTSAEVVELRETLLQTLLDETNSSFETVLELPRVANEAFDFLTEYFKHGIRYLGPLRDSPRPVYQLEALESTTDVGYQGEHTAAVLDLNSTRRIPYHAPPVEGADEDYLDKPVSKRASLHDAVVEWLAYLGVAEEVVTTDAGVFGNRLQVSTDQLGRLHDLTNVGVGVSQVLPIVVTALLAPRGSFLIFEQPELHLHPKVQARLADFFLSLALDGKQTLLETHSEYLVDRFRLRVALSNKDKVRPLINILFTQKTNAQSTLTPVEINEYGAIVNWPKDFFEQSGQEVGRIIQAASRKRKSTSQNQLKS